MKTKVLPIHIFGENQIAVVDPIMAQPSMPDPIVTEYDEDGNPIVSFAPEPPPIETYPDGTIEVDLEYPAHLYTWDRVGNEIVVSLDQAKTEEAIAIRNAQSDPLAQLIAEIDALRQEVSELRAAQGTQYQIVI